MESDPEGLYVPHLGGGPKNKLGIPSCAYTSNIRLDYRFFHRPLV